MTFKHRKFEDSDIMQSFIKNAHEKGWVKSDPIKKSAALDLSPTHNLTENILNLCAGLRKSGLYAFAEEIEQKFIAYKRAAELYDVHQEEGKDLVDAAHPDGSYQLEGVEGDSVIETIIDQHMQDLKMVNKKPTGKLANSHDILKAVKVALAEEPDVQKKILEKMKDPNTFVMLQGYIQQIADSLANIIGQAAKAGSLSRFDRWRLNGNVDAIRKVVGNPSAQNIVETVEPSAKWIAGTLKSILEDNQDVWGAIAPDFGKVWALIKNAKQARQAMDNPKAVAPTPPVAPAPVAAPKTKSFDDVVNQLKGLRNKLSSWRSIGAIAKNPAAAKWIKDEIATLDDIFTRYSGVEEDQKPNMIAHMQKEINTEKTDIDQFENTWLK